MFPCLPWSSKHDGSFSGCILPWAAVRISLVSRPREDMFPAVTTIQRVRKIRTEWWWEPVKKDSAASFRLALGSTLNLLGPAAGKGKRAQGTVEPNGWCLLEEIVYSQETISSPTVSSPPNRHQKSLLKEWWRLVKAVKVSSFPHRLIHS